jgi:hypothetical protein
MTQGADLYIKQMELGPMENFVYLVGSKETREVFVVDPAWQVDTVLIEGSARRAGVREQEGSSLYGRGQERA